MSWHYKENYENLSEIHPRRQPPKGQGQHAVARIQPIVPEVSMVSHRQPLGVLNGQRGEKSYEDSLCRTIPANAPPQPQQPPLRGDFRTQNISMYREDSTAESLKRMNLAPKQDSFAQDQATLNTFGSLVKIIQGQSEDIARLNQQVADLQKCVDFLMQHSREAAPRSPEQM